LKRGWTPSRKETVMLNQYGYQIFGILSTVVAAVIGVWAYSPHHQDYDAPTAGQQGRMRWNTW